MYIILLAFILFCAIIAFLSFSLGGINRVIRIAISLLAIFGSFVISLLVISDLVNSYSEKNVSDTTGGGETIIVIGAIIGVVITFCLLSKYLFKWVVLKLPDDTNLVNYSSGNNSSNTTGGRGSIIIIGVVIAFILLVIRRKFR